MTWYLAGPMSGIEDANYPAFKKAAAELRAAGYCICSPAEQNGLHPDTEWLNSLRADLISLLGCRGIILLPGWAKSRGARLELQTALALEMPAMIWHNGKLTVLDQGR